MVNRYPQNRGVAEELFHRLWHKFVMQYCTYVWHQWEIRNNFPLLLLCRLVVVLVTGDLLGHHKHQCRMSCGQQVLGWGKTGGEYSAFFAELMDLSSSVLRDQKATAWLYCSLVLKSAAKRVVLGTNRWNILHNQKKLIKFCNVCWLCQSAYSFSCMWRSFKTPKTNNVS